MSSLPWKLIGIAAQSLETDEREAVLGDLQEQGRVSWQGVSDVAGLFMRRQLAPWAGWRPWLAGVGIALPNSFLLMGNSVAVSLALLRAPSKLDLTAPLACHFFFLLLWAWIAGYAVGSLSQKTLWASIALCFAPCLFCLTRFHMSPLSRFNLLLFVVPAAVGVLHSFSRFRIQPAFALATALTATLCMFSWYTMGGMWACNWLLLWPIWLIALHPQQLRAEAP